MEEEIRAAAWSTGWGMRLDFFWPRNEENIARMTAEIVASIDAGMPVLAYEPTWNVDVVYGYEQGGQVLLLRDRRQEEDPLRLPPSRLGSFTLFVLAHVEPPPRQRAVAESLHAAVRNWRRIRFSEGHAVNSEYWYGRTALERWIEDLGDVEGLPEQDLAVLCNVSSFNAKSLCDARRAAVPYLAEAAALLSGRARSGLERAGALYQREAEIVARSHAEEHSFPAIPNKWSPDLREREQEILSQAIELEQEAVAGIEEALAASTDVREAAAGRPAGT